MSLLENLASLSPELLQRLRTRGFDADRLVTWAATVGRDRDGRNRLRGLVEAPSENDIVDAPVAGSPEHASCTAIGLEALRRGDVALCVLAGGMATRMGGVVKALVDALPGRTFLDLRLAENAALGRIAGRPVPLWLMTSEATDGPLKKALADRHAGDHVATFEQCVSLRLNLEGDLFRDGEGAPSVYATGHGDLPDALRSSGLLGRFVSQPSTGKKIVCIANIDNLGATVDPAIVGFHLAHGEALTCELVDKVGSDKGGGPVRYEGRAIIVEEFRLPLGFDATSVPVFNTNTFLVDADALDKLAMNFTYVEVEKAASGQKAVQFERLLGEITTGLPTRMLRVPREGVASRFLPVKDTAELERRRPEIEAIARARGLIEA